MRRFRLFLIFTYCIHCCTNCCRTTKNTVRRLATEIREVRRRAEQDVLDAKKFGANAIAKDVLGVKDDLERTVCIVVSV